MGVGGGGGLNGQEILMKLCRHDPWVLIMGFHQKKF